MGKEKSFPRLSVRIRSMGPITVHTFGGRGSPSIDFDHRNLSNQ
jgi:hypothetical protein